MSAARWALLGAKVAVPVLAVATFGAVVVAAPRLDAGAAGNAPHRPPAAVALDAAELVCPGPETIGVRGASSGSAGTPPGPVQVFAASAPTSVRPALPGPGSTTTPPTAAAGADPEAETGAETGAVRVRSTDGRELGAGRAGATGSTTQAGSPVVTASGSAAPGLVAEQTSVVRSGDLRGLTSATCLPARDDQWLVGGGTDAGRRGRLVLTNPHDATTQVSVDVLSTDGALPRTPGSTVALAARTRTVLLLDALAPRATSPVLHVRSSGGTVGAVLHDAWLDGTTPRGTDDVVAAPRPATRVLVPGVRIDGAATLRLAVPGAAEAVAVIRLLGEKGAVDLPDGGVLRVPASTTRDVDLGSVPAGAYTVQVTADVPLLAGAVVQRRATPTGPSDLAWSAASDELSSLTGMAGIAGMTGLPGGPTWQSDLVLGAPDGTASVLVTTVAPGGPAVRRAVQVPAGSTKVFPVGPGQLWVSPEPGSAPVVAARSLSVSDPAGLLLTAGPLRQVALSRVPADVVPAAE